jgi:hypothetical protein
MRSTLSTEKRRRWFSRAQCRHAVGHAWHNYLHSAHASGRGRSSGCPRLYSAPWSDRFPCTSWQMGPSFPSHHVGAGRPLQVRPEPHRATMALGHLGQRVRRNCMACRVGVILMVCRELWQLQQDLWFSWRNHRLYDLDLTVHHRRFGRSSAQCRDRASDRARQHTRPAEAARKGLGCCPPRRCSCAV